MVVKGSADDIAAKLAKAAGTGPTPNIERLHLRYEDATGELDRCLAKLLYWAGRVQVARRKLRNVAKALGKVDTSDVEAQEP